MRQSKFVTPCLLLLSLAMFIATGYSPNAVAQTSAFAHVHVTPAEKAIYKAFNKRQDFKLKEIPLSQFAEDLQKQFGVNVRLDTTALDEAGIAMDSPICIDFKNLSLRSALRHILWDFEVTYIIQDEVLLITPYEVAENTLSTRVYKVGDLIKDYPWIDRNRNKLWRDDFTDDNKAYQDFDTLIELIESTVATESWYEVGGPGSIKEVQPDMLAVSQTQEVHEQVAVFLENLRKTPVYSKQTPGTVYPIINNLMESEEDKNILKKLDQVTTLEFIDTPLNDVMKSIAENIQVNIKLDTTALDEAGIQTDTPVTVNLRNIKLSSALKLMLGDFELTYIVLDEVLLVTTVGAGENELTNVLYPVGDLLQKNRKGIICNGEYDQLIEAIRSCVAFESWDDTSGPGSIAYFSQRALLVVSQTEEVHEKIAGFLAQVRALQKTKSTNVETPKNDPAEMGVRTYWLTERVGSQYPIQLNGGSKAMDDLPRGSGFFLMSRGKSPIKKSPEEIAEAAANRAKKSAEEAKVSASETAQAAQLAAKQAAKEFHEETVKAIKPLINRVANIANGFGFGGGGSGSTNAANAYVVYLPDRIIIRHRRDVHEKLFKLLVEELHVARMSPVGWR